MAVGDFWQALPEFQVLTQIAEDLHLDLRLRGSLARSLLEVGYRSAGEAPGSMFDFVQPFSDIDLVVPSTHDAHQVGSLIAAHLPQSRFFHWEIQTEEDVKRYTEWAYIRLVGQPEIAFLDADGKRRKNQTRADPVAVRCRYASGHLAVDVDMAVLESMSKADPEIEPNNARKKALDDSVAPLVDLLYVARSYPRLLEHPNIRRLLDYVEKSARFDEHIRRLTRDSVEYGRLLLGLLKLLYAEPVRRDGLPGHFGESFARLSGRFGSVTTDSDLKVLFARFHEREYGPVAAVLRPEPHHGRWIRRLHRLEPIYADWVRRSQKTLTEFLELVQEIEIVREVEKVPPVSLPDPDSASWLLSPMFTLMVDDPPPPGCCRYGDFSRGAVEMAWTDPAGPNSPTNAGFVAVDLGPDGGIGDKPVGGEGSEDRFMLAHAYTVFHKVGTVRTDYNFISLVAGSRRPVKMLAVGRR